MNVLGAMILTFVVGALSAKGFGQGWGVRMGLLTYVGCYLLVGGK